MITQYRFGLTPDCECRPMVEWAYCLYAALLEQAPPAFGNRVHKDGTSPVSQFLQLRQEVTWQVTLLGKEAEETLGPVLEREKPLWLHKERVWLAPHLLEKREIPNPDALFVMANGFGKREEVRFVTPTAFKTHGIYQILPSVRLILQSTIKKWNGCFPNCPIEDEDGQGIDALAEGLLCRKLSLKDQTYFLKGRALPGFIGSIQLENRLEGFHAQLANALLLFAGCAGVGIKTTLGMGGVLYGEQDGK